MRVLIIHNYYQQAGGEDIVFEEETQMLRDEGHDVFQFTAHNADIHDKSLSAVAINTLWSREAQQAVASKIADVQPDIVHFHNTFMSISPSAYYACKTAGVPVVQTLHNYRLLCPKGTLFRNGEICKACMKSPLFIPSVQYGCYRDSRLHTVAVATMLNLHQALATWDKQIDRYICLSESGRQLFIEGGMNPKKLAVKGNFLKYDPGYSDRDEGYFVFMGRLTAEKGSRVLLDAWRKLPDIPLKILGTGALLDSLEAEILQAGMTNVELLGHRPRQEALRILQGATAQIVPSQWYEPFGLVAIEGFACGKPVIAAKIGALADIVAHGVTGLHFDAHDPDALAEQVRCLWHNRELSRSMGRKARAIYETFYTSETNYQQLIAVYQDILTGPNNL